MNRFEPFLQFLGLIVISAPVLLVLFLGIPALVSWKISERTINKAIQISIFSGLLASITILILMLISGSYHVPVEVGHWVTLKDYHFSIKLVFDRLSVPFVILTFILTGTISAFSTRYMHREPGYNRFFVLYAIFVLGMVTASIADTIETMFAGWEMVGLSSAFLVAFFQDRPNPARNGLRVWAVYRFSDAALLLAAVIMHHELAGEGDFDRLLGVGGSWPEGHCNVPEGKAILVGLLLLLAAAGKSALVPFSGWLPRAMEGPTTSSAVFYGALSVHLGAFLLLRVSPIIECSFWLSTAVVVLGLITAVTAYLCGSVQTDIKSALSFASLTQVGIIVAEIGLGFRYIALIHLLGHACLRTLQFVRAPTLLHDYRTLENAIGNRLPRMPGPWDRYFPEFISVWLYRFALERGYLDALLATYVVVPFTRLFEFFDSLERSWTGFLSGWAARESDELKPYSGQVEDLP